MLRRAVVWNADLLKVAAVPVEIRFAGQNRILCLSIVDRMSDAIFTVNVEQCDRVSSPWTREANRGRDWMSLGYGD